jgi:hypothetical protein
MDLGARGLVARTKKYVDIADWKRLEDVGGFSDNYLHLHDENSLLP